MWNSDREKDRNSQDKYIIKISYTVKTLEK